jgi:UDP-glucose 4-epimerase
MLIQGVHCANIRPLERPRGGDFRISETLIEKPIGRRDSRFSPTEEEKVSTTMVTGGLGFAGRFIVDRAAEQGDRVISYNRDFAFNPRPGVIAVQGELFDIPRLVRTMDEHKVDRIVHTAAMSHPGLSIELPLTTFAANIDGTIHLFEAARMAGVKRIVNFSSECSYGHQVGDGPMDEDTPQKPLTPYGVTKVAAELLGSVYNDLYGLDVVSLRVTEIYGPGLRMPEVLRDMLVAALRGKKFELSPGGDHRFQFIHVEDVARAALLAAAANGTLSRTTYNVSGGEQFSLKELAERVRERWPEAEIELGDGFIPDWDRLPRFDIGAAERDFGYIPEYDLERGMTEYAAWLGDHEY